MTIATARAHLARHGLEDRVVEFDVSSATVDLAAAALGVEPARIAKTLSFDTDAGPILVVFAGDARVDNRAFKERFGVKARMIPADRVEAAIGHAPGGVCPFGVAVGVPVYLDESLRRFETIYPAAGSGNSAIGLTPEELEQATDGAAWVVVGRLPEPEPVTTPNGA